MKKVSSDIGKYFMYIFPGFFLLLFMVIPLPLLDKSMMIAIILIITRFTTWLAAEDVYDEGDTLLIKRRKTILRVPYSAIKRIKIKFWRLRAVEIVFDPVTSCEFGKKISFIPAVPARFMGGNPLSVFYVRYAVVEVLREKVNTQRKHSQSLQIEKIASQEYEKLFRQWSSRPSIEQTENMPTEIKGWNWGAFFLTWIWGIGNRSYLTFLAFVPLVGFFIMTPVSGVFGNQWAWENKKWDSVEHFKKTQRKWAHWGLFFWLSLLVIYGVLIASHS